MIEPTFEWGGSSARRRPRGASLIVGIVAWVSCATVARAAVDTNISFPSGHQYDKIVQTLQIDAGGPATYWAHNFNLVQQGGYMGLQMGAVRPDGSIGTIANFSIWGGTAGVPGPQGLCRLEDENGSVMQCFIPYDFALGRKYDLSFLLVNVDLTHGTETWWSTVRDQTTGVETLIGAITVSLSAGLVQNTGVVFSEYFGPAPVACSHYAPTSVTWFAATAHLFNTQTTETAVFGTTVYNAFPGTNLSNACQNGNEYTAARAFGVVVQRRGYTQPTSPTPVSDSYSGNVQACNSAYGVIPLYANQWISSGFGWLPAGYASPPIAYAMPAIYRVTAKPASAYDTIRVGNRTYIAPRQNECAY